MSPKINNNLAFTDILNSSLDSLGKNLGKDYFKYLSQEFDSDVLDLVKQKGFYPYEYMCSSEKFKEQLPSKENFSSSLTGKKFSDKNYEHVLKVWYRFQMKNDERLSRLVIKM